MNINCNLKHNFIVQAISLSLSPSYLDSKKFAFYKTVADKTN